MNKKLKTLEWLSTLRRGEDFRFPFGVKKYMYLDLFAGKHVYFCIDDGETFRSVIDKEVVRKRNKKLIIEPSEDYDND